MARSLAPFIFAALLVAGVAAGFLGWTTVENPTSPPEVFVFFDEEAAADFYAAQERNENITHAIMITLMTMGLVGLVGVAGGRMAEAELDAI